MLTAFNWVMGAGWLLLAVLGGTAKVQAGQFDRGDFFAVLLFIATGSLLIINAV